MYRRTMTRDEINDIRRKAFEAGQRSRADDVDRAVLSGARDFRMRATCALAAAGHPPEVFGLVAALPIADDEPLHQERVAAAVQASAGQG